MKQLLLISILFFCFSCASENNETNTDSDSTAPTIPQNLTADAESSSRINLSWDPATDDTGVSGYRIYRDGALLDSTSTTAYADTGLAASTEYAYTVSAYDAAGNESSQSNPDSAVTQEASDFEPSTSPNDAPVSRTSGVAPLAVHFFADFVDAAGGEEIIHRFHHYDYNWNFDDPDSGDWGTTGKSKNIAKGPAAVHIFEEPGDYNITLTIRDHYGVVDTENYSVTVIDPDSFYNGTNTTCVNPSGDNDFSGAPSGARLISTDDLSAITQYATAGSRILFKRGSSWSTSGLGWPSNAGPVTIGAYGTGTNPDAQGIFDNAPQITVTDGYFVDLNDKQNWRFMDLHLTDSTRSHGSFSGAACMQRQLFLRLKIEGFLTGLTWSHWNESDLMPKDDMVIASCSISDCGDGVAFVGSERLAVLGNILKDAHDTHVLRVWQAYRSVISHNIISGSSLSSGSGRHALKLHGPGGGSGSFGEPIPNTGLMNVRTEYDIISDNIFGSSGPWPVAIGPQNDEYDERLSNIIFERNRLQSDYGTQSSSLVNVSVQIWARYCTVRNNIFDATGSDYGYYGIYVGQHATEPPPTNIEIFNNTFYRGDGGSDTHTAITLMPEVTNAVVRNNLVSFPYTTGTVVLLDDQGADTVSTNNLNTDNAHFTNPDAANPLDRDFTLQTGSPALDQGASVPVYDDYLINPRPESDNDLGAFEQ